MRLLRGSPVHLRLEPRHLTQVNVNRTVITLMGDSRDRLQRRKITDFLSALPHSSHQRVLTQMSGPTGHTPTSSIIPLLQQVMQFPVLRVRGTHHEKSCSGSVFLERVAFGGLGRYDLNSRRSRNTTAVRMERATKTTRRKDTIKRDITFSLRSLANIASIIRGHQKMLHLDTVITVRLNSARVHSPGHLSAGNNLSTRDMILHPSA